MNGLFEVATKTGWFNTGIVPEKIGLDKMLKIESDLEVHQERNDKFLAKYNGSVTNNEYCGIWSSRETFCLFVSPVEGGGTLYLSVSEPMTLHVRVR